MKAEGSPCRTGHRWWWRGHVRRTTVVAGLLITIAIHARLFLLIWRTSIEHVWSGRGRRHSIWIMMGSNRGSHVGVPIAAGVVIHWPMLLTPLLPSRCALRPRLLMSKVDGLRLAPGSPGRRRRLVMMSIRDVERLRIHWTLLWWRLHHLLNL